MINNNVIFNQQKYPMQRSLPRHRELLQWVVRLVADVEAERDLTSFNSIHNLTLELVLFNVLFNRRLNSA